MTTQRRRFVLVVIVVALVALVSFGYLLSRNYLFDKAAASIKVGEFGDAVGRLKVVAYMGDPKAQRLLGDLYALGWGAPKNDGEAIKWYRRAGPDSESARDPGASAMYYIGRKYLGGEGIPQNESEARKWLERSAQGGYAKASEQLASMSVAGH